MGFFLLIFKLILFIGVTTGQTLGEMISKTKVVNKNGTHPSVFKIFARTLLRLVPIDIVSYLFGTELGFHDVLSGTKLKKIAL